MTDKQKEMLIDALAIGLPSLALALAVGFAIAVRIMGGAIPQ